jgi:hypothetical protein
MNEPADPLQPILAMMSYRGGARLARCLDSIEESQHHFKRIILSVTATEDSDDMRQCLDFQRNRVPRAEVICTGEELPTMQHQAFWVTYLERTGTMEDDWIYWLSYDDQVRSAGIDEIADAKGNWPLEQGIMYVGPWAMRHEGAEKLWDGDPTEPLEVWTSFPIHGPSTLPVLQWIRQQLNQPTYVQMTGSVCAFAAYLEIRDSKPVKRVPMRIEMATAATARVLWTAELSHPVSTIYGRSNSDRASYKGLARKQDGHLLIKLASYCGRHPSSSTEYGHILAKSFRSLTRRTPVSEEWRVRGICNPR